MNSSSIPSGLPGMGVIVDYKTGRKDSNRKANHEFYLRLIYAELKQTFSNDYTTRPYHHFELSSGVSKYYFVPCPIEVVDIEAGFGLSLNALYGINSMAYTSNMQPYGNWYIAPSLTARASYSFERLSFRAAVGAPVMAIGFFREYEIEQPQSYNKPLQFISFYGIPNTLALPGKFNKIDVSGSVIYLLSKKENYEIRFLTQIDWQGIKLNIHGNREAKNCSGVNVGITINR